jgi:hypothetical protein
MGEGLRTIGRENPAAAPFTLGPYTWDQFLQMTGGIAGANTPGDMFYLDGNKSFSGDGKSWSRAFTTMKEGIAALNSSTNKNSILFVGEGYYIEKASEIPTLTASDVSILALNPYKDATVLFGSGDNGSVSTADDDLLTITGNNNLIYGLGFYVHKNDKSAIVFDDTGGANTASFNRFVDCTWTKEAVDGQQYGVSYKGGNYNSFHNCYFTAACKDAAINFNGQTGNPAHNEIKCCSFIGTTYAVRMESANHNCIIAHNYGLDGSITGESITDFVVATSGFNAGEVLVADNWVNVAAADIVENGGTGTIAEADNHATS